MPQGTRKEKLQQKDFTMTSSSSLVYQGKYCMISGRSLIAISSSILLNSVKNLNFTVPPSDQWSNREDESNHNMFKTLAEKNKSNWMDHIQKLVCAYNCMTHSSTGYSPYYVPFGCTPKLPIDLIIPSPATDHEQKPIHLMLTNGSNRWHKHMKLQIDSQCRESQKMLSNIMLGDHVLVWNMSEQGGRGK